MYAVVVRVSISDVEQAREALREEVVPRVAEAPGFTAGYWTSSDDGRNGLSMIVFESEDAARGAAERIPGTVPETVTLDSVEVREVIEHA